MPGIFDALLEKNRELKWELKKGIILSTIYDTWKDKTLYEILGVDRQMSDEVIKQTCREAYVTFLRIFHPNRAGQDSQSGVKEALTKLVVGAHSTLTNSWEKMIYDREQDTKTASYASTFARPPQSQPQYKPAAEPKAKPKISLPEDKWQDYCAMTEDTMKQFIHNNPDKINLPFYSQSYKKEVTPLEFVCLGMKAKPHNLKGLKQLLLNNTRIPFYTADATSRFFSEALNALITIIDPRYSDISLNKILTEDELYKLLNDNPHILDYLDSNSKTILLYTVVGKLDLQLTKLVAESIGSLENLQRIRDENYHCRTLFSKICYYSAQETPFEKLFELISYLMSNGHNITDLDITMYLIGKDKVNLLKALLCCGMLIPNSDLETIAYGIKHPGKPNAAITFLASLPKTFLGFHKAIDAFYRFSPWKELEELRQEISKIVQTCHFRKINRQDIASHLTDASFIEDMANTVASYIKAKSDELHNNYQLALLGYYIPSSIKVLPITDNTAVQLLQNKSVGDYIVHYHYSVIRNCLAITCVEKPGQCTIVELLEYLDHSTSIDPKRPLDVSLADLFNVTTSNGDTVLHDLVKQPATESINNNRPLVELLAHAELAKKIINTRDKAGRTALYYAAQSPLNREVCETMVRLGATTSDFYVNSYLLKPFASIAYIDKLVALEREVARQMPKPGASVQMSLARQRVNELKQRYAKEADQYTAIGILNLALLKGDTNIIIPMHQTTHFFKANNSSMACAILSENTATIQSLLAKGFVITSFLPKLAIMTENKIIIEMIFRHTHRSQWPTDVTDVLKLCNQDQGIQQFVKNIMLTPQQSDQDELMFKAMFDKVMSGNHSDVKADEDMADAESSTQIVASMVI